MSFVEENKRNNLTFQMNSLELNTLFTNLKKIKDQLNLLISEKNTINFHNFIKFQKFNKKN